MWLKLTTIDNENEYVYFGSGGIVDYYSYKNRSGDVCTKICFQESCNYRLVLESCDYIESQLQRIKNV